MAAGAREGDPPWRSGTSHAGAVRDEALRGRDCISGAAREALGGGEREDAVDQKDKYLHR